MDIILGIETSCDETAASVVVDGRDVRSNTVSSQISKHAAYGGVVPELAAREHLLAIEMIVSEALKSAGFAINEVGAVAVTNGPGLIPALLVGLNYARGLAYSNNIPLIGVNHFTAHIYGTFLGAGVDLLERRELYPILALVVSGGHTALVLINSDGRAKIVGSTIDDAAGEAFDKAAKLLGLGYPGGPAIEKNAQKGDPAKFAFPRSLTGSTGRVCDPENRFNFSFSGVKTSLYYHCKKFGGGEKMGGCLLCNTAASYQEAVIDVLCSKTMDAAVNFAASSVVLCGGVACNGALRKKFQKNIPSKIKLFIAESGFCSDNAAMIAGCGWHFFKKGLKDGFDLDAYSRMREFTNVPFAN